MKKIFFFIITLGLFKAISFSQNVGIGTTTPNASAQLDVTSASKGLLLPRMTQVQRNAILSPANGLMIYQTDGLSGFYYYDGLLWIQFGTGSATNYWTTNGTSIFNNNIGNVGIGVSPPAYKLDIDGRMRIRTGTVGSVSTSSGMWLEDYRNGTNRIFLGMQDSIHAGFYGGGSGDVGWDFNFNATNGNIGIGADNPSDKLHVKGFMRIDPVGAYGGARLKMYSATNIDQSYIGFYNQFSASNPSATIGYSSGNNHLFLSCGTGDMFLSDAGLGIETASPTAKLHVNGNVMIGSGSPALGYSLSVNGKIISEEVRVALSGTPNWPDYVFENDYRLMPLPQLEKFISQQKHLPDIPSASQVKKEGFDLGNMNRRLLEKIEELTLYIIAQDKKINSIQEQIQLLQSTPKQ